MCMRAAGKQLMDAEWCLVERRAGAASCVLSLYARCLGSLGPLEPVLPAARSHPHARDSTSAGTAVARRRSLCRFSLLLALGLFGRGIFYPTRPRLFLVGMGVFCLVQL